MILRCAYHGTRRGVKMKDGAMESPYAIDQELKSEQEMITLICDFTQPSNMLNSQLL